LAVTQALQVARAGREERMLAIKRLPLVAAVVIALLAGNAATADAHHSWGHYHWARTSNPFTVNLGNNVSGGWGSFLTVASDDWTQSGVLNTPVVSGSTSPSRCDPTRTTVQVCSANYGSNGWLGLAQIWITVGSHIAQGVVEVNDYYFGSSSYTYNNSAEQQHVMCQEIGHTLGLDHQDETGASLNTCMDYYHNTSSSDMLSTHPNAHDYDQLTKIYRHLDRFDTTFSTASSNGAAEWATGHGPDGTPHGASRARGNWYVEDLGNGELLFTHVFWDN
jgi:hypothetical protein